MAGNDGNHWFLTSYLQFHCILRSKNLHPYTYSIAYSKDEDLDDFREERETAIQISDAKSKKQSQK